MANYTMMINGNKIAGEKSFGVINPATEAIFSECPEATRIQIDEAVFSAKKAFIKWKINEAERREVLKKCARIIELNLNELCEIITLEQGKPLTASANEVKACINWLNTTSDFIIPNSLLKETKDNRIEIQYKPYGVVAGITPWNYPLLIPIWKIAPALLMGNTVVLKPSPYTPLSLLRLGELLGKVLPNGVLNVVAGGNDVGSWLCSHPEVQKVSFTGSVATGKKVAASGGVDLKRVTLELGGNDPAFVLRDVDIPQAAEKIFWNAFANCGQMCIAIKRLYVDKEIYLPFAEELARIAGKIRVTDGHDPEARMGPINNSAQLMRVIDLVQDANANGGKIVTGGKRLERLGYFYPPTIVKDVSDGIRLVDEEQFGPVLPIIPYDNIEEAIDRSNLTHFGLGSSIWTKDNSRAMDLMNHLECGTVWINQHAVAQPDVPFGGAKCSGIGYESGILGLTGYGYAQTRYVCRANQNV